jgi:hypothetical protein
MVTIVNLLQSLVRLSRRGVDVHGAVIVSYFFQLASCYVSHDSEGFRNHENSNPLDKI